MARVGRSKYHRATRGAPSQQTCPTSSRCPDMLPLVIRQRNFRQYLARLQLPQRHLPYARRRANLARAGSQRVPRIRVPLSALSQMRRRIGSIGFAGKSMDDSALIYFDYLEPRWTMASVWCVQDRRRRLRCRTDGVRCLWNHIWRSGRFRDATGRAKVA